MLEAIWYRLSTHWNQGGAMALLQNPARLPVRMLASEFCKMILVVLILSSPSKRIR